MRLQCCSSTLQQLEPEDGNVSVLVMCNTHELAFQISHGTLAAVPPISEDCSVVRSIPSTNKIDLENDTPHIIVGTPGAFAPSRVGLKLETSALCYGWCDKLLEQLDMRRDIRRSSPTPHASKS